MQKFTFASAGKIALLALFLAAASACHHDDIKPGTTSDVTAAPTQYDLTVRADKDGQFEYEGATLNVEDLRGHIRYLNESGQPVKSILLKRGEKEKITNQHVAGLAGIARDLKIQAFVLDNDNRLKVIQIDDNRNK
jgi:hypothetical protein